MLMTGILLATPASRTLAEPPPRIERYAQLVGERFEGDRAYETTAFVEKFWRVPGNTGFNESIFRVESILKQAGYVPEDEADPDARLTYRIERRAMDRPTWEPVSARLTIAGATEPLLDSGTNRNLPCINSHSTPEGGVDADVVYVGQGREDDFENQDVKGKIILGEADPGRLYRQGVQRRGAIGVLSYSIPDFNQPERHPQSIPFSGIPYDDRHQAWGLMLSHEAYITLMQRLETGSLRVNVDLRTKLYESTELTIIARVRGGVAPQDEFVFSAHVQEPGANDNATGVGCQAEMARVVATLVEDGSIDPARTVTFLWGDEISSTARYVKSNGEHIRWGLSLDMVGEDTSKTGGTFLIEKMPDPSAVWPRGDDHFSEWGGEPIGLERMKPHFFNDFIINRCLEQAARTGWVVRTNPFEGGSDHVPFLRGDIPAVLMWHFTDVYYHTDGDRIEMVSRETLRNVGVSALVSALTLASADETTARLILDETLEAGLARLRREFDLSVQAIKSRGDLDAERRIINAWIDWYAQAIDTCRTVPVGDPGADLVQGIGEASDSLRRAGSDVLGRLEGLGAESD